MKKKKIFLFSLLLIAVLFLSAFFLKPIFKKKEIMRYSKKEEYTIPIGKEKEIHLDCDNARINISGWNRNEIKYIIIKKLEGEKLSKEEALKIMTDEMMVRLLREQGKVYLKAKAYLTDVLTNAKVAYPLRNFEININMPQNVNLTIQNGNGSINVDKLNGRIYIVNGNGKINAKNIQGDIDIRNGNGQIDLFNLSSYVSISNGNGNMNISLKNSKGFNITNGNGKITLRLDKINAEQESVLNLGNCDIDINFSSNTNAYLQINTINSLIKSDYKYIKRQNSYEVLVNNGKNLINIINGSGHIKLLKD